MLSMAEIPLKKIQTIAVVKPRIMKVSTHYYSPSDFSEGSSNKIYFNNMFMGVDFRPGDFIGAHSVFEFSEPIADHSGLKNSRLDLGTIVTHVDEPRWMISLTDERGFSLGSQYSEELKNPLLFYNREFITGWQSNALGSYRAVFERIESVFMSGSQIPKIF